MIDLVLSNCLLFMYLVLSKYSKQTGPLLDFASSNGSQDGCLLFGWSPLWCAGIYAS